MNLNLQHKNALVGGSSKGIGKATAMELALLGANVTLMARNESALKFTLSELDTSLGQQHDYLVIDVNDAQKLQSLVEAKINQNPYHILVNNTGGPAAGPIENASAEQFEAAFRQHLLVNHQLVQLLLPSMKKEGYGRIINVISTSVKQPLENLGVSNTIRWAVASWAKTMANELGAHGITVNNVLPGATATERLSQIIDNQAQKNNISYEIAASKMSAEIPMRRFAAPQEVAAAVAFLASPAAAYITGINLPVDGGRLKTL